MPNLDSKFYIGNLIAFVIIHCKAFNYFNFHFKSPHLVLMHNPLDLLSYFMRFQFDKLMKISFTLACESAHFLLVLFN